MALGHVDLRAVVLLSPGAFLGLRLASRHIGRLPD